jgi:uncharacterized protein
MSSFVFAAALAAAQPAAPVATPPVTFAPAPAGAVDPAAFAAARELLIATHFDDQVRAMTEQVTERSIATILAQFRANTGTDFPAELETMMRRLLREHNDAVLAALRPHALDDCARLYARYFSADEIRELQRLQTNPVMMKFQRIAPQFVAEASQLAMPEVLRRMPELQRRIGAAIDEWLARHPADRHPTT